MRDNVDHSHRLATIHMSIEAATLLKTPGQMVNYRGPLLAALYFNLGRNQACGGAEDWRTVAHEELLEQATAVGLSSVASCRYVYYTRKVESWCIAEAHRRLAGRRDALVNAPTFPDSNLNCYTLPALDDLQCLITLTNRLWTYLALLEARAGGNLHGYLGPLADVTFVPFGTKNRQANLTRARKARADIAEQMENALETRGTNHLSGFLGRLENQFRVDAASDPSRLLDFLAADLQSRPATSTAHPESWAVLKELAGYDLFSRHCLLAAFQTFKEAYRSETQLLANNPLEVWLGRLPEQPDNQHQPAQALAYLLGISPAPLRASIPEEETAVDPNRRDSLHNQLAIALVPGSWQSDLLVQIQRDCTRRELLAWSRRHNAALPTLPDSDALRNAVAARVGLWASYAAAGGREKAPACCALFDLEMPEASAARLSEVASALAVTWPAGAEVSDLVREVIDAGVLSVRLEGFTREVGAARNAIGGKREMHSSRGR